MSQQLNLQIELARSIFTARAIGQEPKKVLLGKHQMKELNEIVQGMTLIHDDRYIGKRTTYRGLEAYPVDDEQYCEVCS
jgi:hypothetical protein